MTKAISVSTVPIFTIFSPNGRYLREFSWPGSVFPILQGTLPWQPVLFRTTLVRSEPKFQDPLDRISLMLKGWQRSTDWQIINPLSKGSMAIIRLHHVQIWWTSCSNLGVYAVTMPQFICNLTTMFICHVGVSKRIERSQFWFQHSNRQPFLYILHKLGEIQFSDLKV